MTLDEAIKHAENVAEEHTKYNRYGGFESCDECAAEYRQLAEWLKDYKRLLEQEPKSEWQHDHEVLKAYSDGANDILDKIRAEIEEEYGDYDICEWFADYDYEENDISEYQQVGDVSDILAIIDKYRVEGRDKE